MINEKKLLLRVGNKLNIILSIHYINFLYNDATTRQFFKNKFEKYLHSQKRITKYNVICDLTNNTANVINSGQFVISVNIEINNIFRNLTFTIGNKIGKMDFYKRKRINSIDKILSFH